MIMVYVMQSVGEGRQIAQEINGNNRCGKELVVLM